MVKLIYEEVLDYFCELMLINLFYDEIKYWFNEGFISDELDKINLILICLYVYKWK